MGAKQVEVTPTQIHVHFAAPFQTSEDMQYGENK
jgi:hypothetical protein